jgi:cytochrome c-type biogenesis protein CcsB
MLPDSVLHQAARALASVKLTVGILVVLLGVLTAGTLVESRQGAEAARAVYGSAWFETLLALFAVNLAFSLWDRWPWKRHQIGFALTHTSMLVILLGAFFTDQFKVEGHLALWEGETSRVFTEAGGPEGSQRLMPFAVRLDAFEIDVYPGTRRPAMFRSRVTVQDPDAGTTFPAVIEMNRELAYRGLKLFQSSYRQAGGREMTVLSVSQDPGQPIVFFGYGLLVLGMSTVFATRIVQSRARGRLEQPSEAGRPAAGGPAKLAGEGRAAARAASFLLPLVTLVSLAVWGVPLTAVEPAAEPTPAAAAPAEPQTDLVESLRRVAVQHDGRVMPLDTLAREAVWKVTGERRWDGLDPVTVVLGWSFDPQTWLGRPLVAVGEELAADAGLPPGTRHASFEQLAASPRIRERMTEARERAAREQPLAPVLEEAQKLEERLVWIDRFLRRDALRVMPPAGAAADSTAAWSVPGNLAGPEDLLAAAAEARAAAPEAVPSTALLEREVTTNRVQPARLAWWILLPAALLALAAWQRPRRLLDLLAGGGLLAGVVVMTWGLAVRWQIAGRIPASNMYESLLFLGWGVGLFALVAVLFLRNRLVIFDAAAMAALTMVLVDRLPIDPFIHPMPPVLSGTPWLAIHVPIIMVSYSVLALGVLVAHLQVGLTIFAPRRREAAARMNRLLYWYMQIGSILLVAGILTGSIWAASSWGRYWGWDPKEVWSLIAFLAYMAILHARIDRQIGPFGVAAASIGAFWAILMTYIGVNYILAAGLHSYGFGGGAVVTWMALVGLAEILFLTAGLAAHLRNRRRGLELVLPVPV